MYLKTDNAFIGLKNKIKAFLSKYGNKAPGTNDKEYQEALTRYRKLTDDYNFQEKLHELAMLETILIQANCIENIRPVAVIAKTTDTTSSIYVRSSYLDPANTVNHHVSRSLGATSKWQVKSATKALDNPDLRQQALTVLKKAMQERFLYPVYKARFGKN